MRRLRTPTQDIVTWQALHPFLLEREEKLEARWEKELGDMQRDLRERFDAGLDQISQQIASQSITRRWWISQVIAFAGVLVAIGVALFR